MPGIDIKKLAAICILAFALPAGANQYESFASIKTVSSDFTMHKYLAIAVQPLVSTGRLYFEKPGFLRWEYTSPFPSGVILNGKKAYSWKGTGGAKEVKDISSQPFAKAMAAHLYMFVSMNMTEITAHYTLKEREGGLILVPRDQSVKQTISGIDISFNAARNNVTKVEMYERSGDKTVIVFTSGILDAEISPELKKP
ncbi:MAG: outer membrane lipoprotein carrier protein LolA [Spirochaetota bacterium]|jgi:outer membrane lipoprotein carrier protein|nr:outer membrane lipoprotein carrier protein LolA [Spirochaetota bacterium]